MRFVELDELKVGMIPAEDIYDEGNKVMLLDSSKALDEHYIEGLRKNNIQGIYIEDALSKGLVIHDAINRVQRKRTVNALKNMDFDATRNEAKGIVSGIVKHGTISMDMKDMRDFDNYTFFHSVNVAVLATVIGKGYGLNSTDLLRLCESGLFHDLGKTKVDKNILNKPGRLTKEEFAEIKKHTEFSYEILKERKDIIEDVRLGALYHHENYDGTGYPHGLAGEKIPLFARILRVADVYDSLMSKRPYKEPFPSNETIEYLMGGSGTLFDPKVVISFIKAVPVFPLGQTVRLSDGREGFVFENNHQSVLRPKIKLFDGSILDLAAPKNLSLGIKVTGTEQPDMAEEFARRALWSTEEKKTVMICDKKEDYTSIMSDFEVEFATDIKVLVRDMMKNGTPDLLILHMDEDITNLPIALQLHKAFPNLKIVFSFDRFERSMLLKLTDTRAADYLIKPYNDINLRERIQKAIEK